MNADAHYLIGHSHKVCQDYALASDDAIIVCDGCSSSPHTDMGARLLAWNAAKYVGKEHFFEEFNHLPHLLSAEARHLFPAVSLDATLMVANRHGKVLVFGDGYVAARNRETGEWINTKIEFPSNAPSYLSYGVYPERAKMYVENDLGTYQVFGWVADGWQLAEEGQGVVIEEDGNPVLGGVCLDVNPEDYDMVVLMTDGIGSFTHQPEGARFPQPVPDIAILNEVLAFKHTQSQFVTLRLNGFFKRTASKRGWTNQDDVGMAAILLPDPNEEAP